MWVPRLNRDFGQPSTDGHRTGAVGCFFDLGHFVSEFDPPKIEAIPCTEALLGTQVVLIDRDDRPS